MNRVASTIRLVLPKEEHGFALLPVSLSMWMGAFFTAYFGLNRVSIFEPAGTNAVVELLTLGSHSTTLEQWWRRIRTQKQEVIFDTRLLMADAPPIVAAALNGLSQPQGKLDDFGRSIAGALLGQGILTADTAWTPPMPHPTSVFGLNLPLYFNSTKVEMGAVTTTQQPAAPYHAFGPTHRAAASLAKAIARMEAHKMSVSLFPKVEKVGVWDRTAPPLGQFLSYTEMLALLFGSGDFLRDQLDAWWVRMHEPLMAHVERLALLRGTNHAKSRIMNDRAARDAVKAWPLHPLFDMAAEAATGWTLQFEEASWPVVFLFQDVNGTGPEEVLDQLVQGYLDWLKTTTSRHDASRTVYGANVLPADATLNTAARDFPLSTAERAAVHDMMPDPLKQAKGDFGRELGWTSRVLTGKRVLYADLADYARCNGDQMEDGDIAIMLGLRNSIAAYDNAVNSAAPAIVQHSGETATNTALVTVGYGEGRYSWPARRFALRQRLLPSFAHAGEPLTEPWYPDRLQNADMLTHYGLAIEDVIGKGPYPLTPFHPEPEELALLATGLQTVSPSVTIRAVPQGLHLMSAEGQNAIEDAIRYLASISGGTKNLTLIKRAAADENKLFRDRLAFRMQDRRFALLDTYGKALTAGWRKRGGPYLLGDVVVGAKRFSDATATIGEATSLEVCRDLLPEAVITGRFTFPTVE